MSNVCLAMRIVLALLILNGHVKLTLAWLTHFKVTLITKKKSSCPLCLLMLALRFKGYITHYINIFGTTLTFLSDSAWKHSRPYTHISGVDNISWFSIRIRHSLEICNVNVSLSLWSEQEATSHEVLKKKPRLSCVFFGPLRLWILK